VESRSTGGESAGHAALNSLFSGSTTSSPAPAPTSLKEAAPASAPADASPSSTPEPGDHGRLGDLSTSNAVDKEHQVSETGGTEGQAPTPNHFEFQVTDASGRRKVKVDLNNKEALAKILPQAYGFRKMQAERDSAKAELAKAAPRLQELESNWQTLENTYQEHGVEGLIDLLGGKKGHFAEWKKAEFEKELRFANASESEKQRIALEEKVARMERESARRAAKAELDAKAAVQARDEASMRNLEAQITPAFNKHRFAGTLGDTAREQAFDNAVWDQALKNLEALPETQDLTPAIIEKEFKSVANTFRAAIGKQANEQARKVIENKKKTASASVAAAVNRPRGPATAEQSMVTNIKKGGIGGLTDALMDVFRSTR